MAMKMKINFALLLDEPTASECKNLSDEIVKVYNSPVVLGPRSLPHVTILQTECEEEELESIWMKSKSVMQPKYLLNLAGLTLLPSSTGRVWVEIQVLTSEAILGLQRLLLDLDVFTDRKVFNAVGNKFRPHITLALLEAKPTQGIPLPYSPLRNSDVVAIPSIGLVGDNYTYIEPIYTLE